MLSATKRIMEDFGQDQRGKPLKEKIVDLLMPAVYISLGIILGASLLANVVLLGRVQGWW